MQVILIQSSGIVTTYFGPFESKSEAKEWATASDITNYCLVILMSPDAVSGVGAERK